MYQGPRLGCRRWGECFVNQQIGKRPKDALMCRKYWKYSDRHQPCPRDGEQPELRVRKAWVVHVLLISLPRNWESAKRSALSMIWQHSHWSLRQLPLGMHRVPSPMLPQHEKKTQKQTTTTTRVWIVFIYRYTGIPAERLCMHLVSSAPCEKYW